MSASVAGTAAAPNTELWRVHQHVARLARSLRIAAIVLEAVAITAGIAAVIAGPARGWHEHTVNSNGATVHPHAWIGVLIAFGGVVQAVWGWVLARALNLYAVDTSARNGRSIVPSDAKVPWYARQ